MGIQLQFIFGIAYSKLDLKASLIVLYILTFSIRHLGFPPSETTVWAENRIKITFGFRLPYVFEFVLRIK